MGPRPLVPSADGHYHGAAVQPGVDDHLHRAGCNTNAEGHFDRGADPNPQGARLCMSSLGVCAMQNGTAKSAG